MSPVTPAAGAPSAPGHPAHRRPAARIPRRPLLLTVHTAAAALALVALAATLRTGVADRGTALAFGLLIALGEFTRWGAPGPDRDEPEREPAPLGAAGALAYALLGEVGGRHTGQHGVHGVLQVVAVVLAATLAGGALHGLRGTGPSADHLARRVLGVAFAAVCCQPLHLALSPGRGPEHGAYYALGVASVVALSGLWDAVLAAALARARTDWPFGPLLRDELRALAGIGSAVGATGAVIALGVAVAALWALPVFSLPLLLSQLAFRRYAAVRTTYRQTIASLARAPEIAGYTPPGHARRVAVLSRAIGRELGLTGRELTVVEQAALLHDIGQLSLVDPVRGGATAALRPERQRRIALLGGAVVRQTGGAAEVALVVERQAEPYREQPLAARIVRAANAYDEIVRAEGPTGALTALERLRLATGRDYQPEVVECLARVLARESASPWPGS